MSVLSRNRILERVCWTSGENGVKLKRNASSGRLREENQAAEGGYREKRQSRDRDRCTVRASYLHNLESDFVHARSRVLKN